MKRSNPITLCEKALSDVLALDDASLGREGYAALEAIGVRHPDRIVPNPLVLGNSLRQFLGHPAPEEIEVRKHVFRQYLHMVAWTNVMEDYQRIPLLVFFAVQGIMSLEKPE